MEEINVAVAVFLSASLVLTIIGCSKRRTKDDLHLARELPTNQSARHVVGSQTPSTNPNKYVSKECNNRSGLLPDDPDLRSSEPMQKNVPKTFAYSPDYKSTSNESAEFGEAHAHGVPHCEVKSHFLAQ